MRLPNGYGSVRKLSGRRRNPWMVQKTVGFELDHDTGRTRQIMQTIGYFPTKKAGLDALAKFNTKPWNLDGRHTTVKDIYEIWSKKKYATASNSSVSLYKASWKHLEPLWDIPITELHTDPMQDVIDETDRSTAILSSMKVILRSCFDYALKNDMVEKNYAEYIEFKKTETRIVRKLYDAEHINRLWQISQAGDNLGADVALILLYTGMRVGELLELPRDCCHIAERYLDIQHAKTSAGKRHIPLHKEIIPVLKKYKNRNGKYLICEDGRQQIKYEHLVLYRMPAVYDAIGEEHTMHDTRHTFISRWKELDLDGLYVKRIVGHSSKGVTDTVYTHVKLDSLLKEIDRFSYS